MATWVEDIVQAFKNLGGQAHRKQIFEEIKRIRKEPLPNRLEQTVQRVIQDHSSDSTGFRGNDLFKKVGNGVWALRDFVGENPNKAGLSIQDHTSADIPLDKEEDDTMTTWVEDIVQALKNLGGQAADWQIQEEVKNIRGGPLPPTWRSIINHIMGDYSSDVVYFKGKRDIFRKVDKGIWALRDQADVKSSGTERYNLSPLKDQHPGVANKNNTTWQDEERSMITGQIKRSQVSYGLISSTKAKEVGETTWLEDIIQALKNLGGQATEWQIKEEVRRIRGGRLPKTWRSMIHHILGDYSSDVTYFKGKDVFRKVDQHVWALRDYSQASVAISPSIKHTKSNYQTYLPPETMEEITNILHTVSQYRDYYGQDISSWKEYVLEFFHILGFSTRPIYSQLYSLDVIGGSQDPLALLIILNADEYLEVISPFSSRDLEYFVIAEEYQTGWVIVTNGIQLQILSYGGKESFEPAYWRNLDLMIYNEQMDGFFTLYKALSFIRETKTNSSGLRLKKDKRFTILNQERLIFYGQLDKKIKHQNKLIYKRTAFNGISQHLSIKTEISGRYYKFFITANRAWVELEIRNNSEQNQQFFNEYLQYQKRLEKALELSLEWQSIPDKKICYIKHTVAEYGLLNKERWEELQDKMIEAMARLTFLNNRFFEVM